MTTDTTIETTTTYQSIEQLITDGSPFHAAVAWYRLRNAEMVISLTLTDGVEQDLLQAQIGALRADVWSILWDKTDAAERDAALATAKAYLAEQPY